jgi:hypothetical protein
MYRVLATRGALAAVFAVACALPARGGGSLRVIDLRPLADAARPLENPHKGWYHHFPDNSLGQYPVAEDRDLLDFPGMDHVYVRLAWSYLEPHEGEFDWTPVDREVERWTRHGMGIALRVSCREPGESLVEQQRFATPRWVVDAGAKGGHYLEGKPTDESGPWEPDFGDSVFLEKLDRFLAALAERYDGVKWLRYVDVGSLGDWGEGHTSFGSRKKYGFAVRKRHLDLYRKHFRKTQLVVVDDFVAEAPTKEERDRLADEVGAGGMTYRDDSILVDWYVEKHPESGSVAHPGLFDAVYEHAPTILELQHWPLVKHSGAWSGTPDSSVGRFAPGKTGADVMRVAVERLHATYLGYHGDSQDWLTTNPELTAELLNRCGYWYFATGVATPSEWRQGAANRVVTNWENRGVAPAYRRYNLQYRVQSAATGESVEVLTNGDTRDWPPGEKATAAARVALPHDFPTGPAALAVRLWSEDEGRSVELAMDAGRRDADGYYRLTEVTVVAGGPSEANQQAKGARVTAP